LLKEFWSNFLAAFAERSLFCSSENSKFSPLSAKEAFSAVFSLAAFRCKFRVMACQKVAGLPYQTQSSGPSSGQNYAFDVTTRQFWEIIISKIPDVLPSTSIY
jgi:hypothetical protein